LAVARAAIVVALLAGWDALPRMGAVDARLLPPFGDVFPGLSLPMSENAPSQEHLQ